MNWSYDFFKPSTAWVRVSFLPWACSHTTFSSTISVLKVARDLAAESWSPVWTLSAKSYLMKPGIREDKS
jgi:hypothetical protein